jgi:hypothetical protein
MIELPILEVYGKSLASSCVKCHFQLDYTSIWRAVLLLTGKRRHNYVSNTNITTLRFLETLIISTWHSILRIMIFGVEFTK